MLAERSSRMRTVSGAGESIQPSQPPRHEQNQEEERQHPAAENEDLPQLRMAGRGPVGRNEETHRRPVYRAVPHPVQEMDDQRQQSRGEAPQDERLKKSHRAPGGFLPSSRKSEIPIFSVWNRGGPC